MSFSIRSIAIPIAFILAAFSFVRVCGREIETGGNGGENIITSVPRTISYQANLNDGQGGNVPQGDYNIIFSIYDALNGGNLLWAESLLVRVDNEGNFNAALGEIHPLNLSFDIDYYMGLKVESDPEMDPRQKIHMVPYAAVADTSECAITVVDDAINSSAIRDGTIEFSDIGQNGASSGQVMKWSGSAWIADNDETGSGSGNGWVDDSTVVRLETDTDRVGIGTSLPDAKLDIQGVAGDAGYSIRDNNVFFVSPQTPFVGVNIGSPLSATTVFGVNSNYTGLGGMLVSADALSDQPYYGYSVGSLIPAYHYYDGSTSSWKLFCNGKDRIVLDNVGYFGLGVDDPTLPFTLNDSTNNFWLAVFRGHHDEGSGLVLDNTTSPASWEISMAGTNGAFGGTVPDGSFYLYEQGSPAPSLVADTNGYIGIGTKTPTARLNVEGGSGWGAVIEGSEVGLVVNSDIIGAGITGIADYTGTVIGVQGYAKNINTDYDSRGVYGYADGNGDNYGVYGYTFGSGVRNYGVYGKAVGGTVNTGGYFEGSFAGVRGLSSTAGGALVGIGSSTLGIYGAQLSGENTGTGSIYGSYNIAQGTGSPSYGTYSTTQGTGSTNYGIYSSAQGSGTTNYGIYSVANNGLLNYGGYFEGSLYGIYASSGNWAGYFVNDVNIVGMLYKGGGSFRIDHPLDPENKYLQHSFVESPDMMNIYNGNVFLDQNGQATITMPDWFIPLNKDFRYQLTAIGSPGPNLYIAQKMNNGKFVIAGGQPGMEVSWQVTGIRKDAYAEAHRMKVELEKPEIYKGKYLHPEELGKPAEKSISAVHMVNLEKNK